MEDSKTRKHPSAQPFYELCGEFEGLLEQHSEDLSFEDYEALFEEATALRAIGNALFAEDLAGFIEDRLQSARQLLQIFRAQLD